MRELLIRANEDTLKVTVDGNDIEGVAGVRVGTDKDSHVFVSLDIYMFRKSCYSQLTEEIMAHPEKYPGFEVMDGIIEVCEEGLE